MQILRIAIRPGGETSRRARTPRVGMTLIEIVVVVAILAVAAGAVSLGVSRAAGGPPLEVAAREIGELARLGCDLAALQGRAWAVHYDIDEQCVFLTQEGAASETYEAPARLFRSPLRPPARIRAVEIPDGGGKAFLGLCSLAISPDEGVRQHKVLLEGAGGARMTLTFDLVGGGARSEDGFVPYGDAIF